MKQLILFFSLAYLLSWVIWLPLYGQVFGLPALPVLPFHHGIGSLGPLLAAFITTYLVEGFNGVRQLVKRCVTIQPIRYLLVALFSPFILVMLSVLLNFLVNDTSPRIGDLFHTPEFPEFTFIQFFIVNLLFYGFGEETGWRGFALPRVQMHVSPFLAALVMSVFWAIWHWPLFFYRPGMMSMNGAAVAGWFMSLLTGSILLTWLYNKSKGSLFICAVFHSTIDIAFLADSADQHIVNYLGALITLWGIWTGIRMVKSERAND
ncbi:CPBP family intramembrane glutamic endopeptidase [Arsenicibacter rosenii]|uniref:CAAX prenyl protease 2/Lysostaphin resistance protein A-like domain-containing protein n=1 Tax=Arsenicibacter rosenii TaxID=1750698 RepID=A0A1S2VK67_9BACT|nr:type II CAAX endopeptidase family protein [Arsenicibacter rosenii]OIN59161.1 hypothetical protein BLX24_09180 [Arsenicibacter rosenii]